MVLFALGLMSKAMVVTLPVVLLLLDYWPLGRLQATGLRLEEENSEPSPFLPQASRLKPQAFVEKLPLFLMAGGIGVLTLVTQSTGFQSDVRFPLGDRIGNALVAYVAYLGKFFYPIDLSAYYPHPRDGLPLWQTVGSALLLVLITAGTVIWRRQAPYLLVGWLWYLVMLLPVSQVLQLGEYAMADRYTYLPQIGITIAAVWGTTDLCRRWAASTTDRRARAVRWAAAAAATVVTGSLMGCAWRQVSYWRDSRTLWTHALAVNPRTALAHNNLASVFTKEGNAEAAIEHYEQALEIDPRYTVVHFNLAAALEARGQTCAAIEHFRKALESDPNYMLTYDNLGSALVNDNKPQEALEVYRKGLEIDPKNATTQNNLGGLLAQLGNYEEAVGHYRTALELDPKFAQAHYNLANALAKTGKTDEAESHYSTATQIRPEYAEAHGNLANLLVSKKNFDEAVREYRKAIEIKPDYPLAQVNLAMVLASRGEIDEALAMLNEIVKAHPESADTHFALGTLLNRQRKTRDAVWHWRQGLRLQPGRLDIVYRVAWTLATSPDDSVRDGARAFEYASAAVKATGSRDPLLLDALAAAYAEMGQFPAAAQIAAQAVTLAEALGNKPLAEALRERLQTYRAERPYRETQ